MSLNNFLSLNVSNLQLTEVKMQTFLYRSAIKANYVYYNALLRGNDRIICLAAFRLDRRCRGGTGRGHSACGSDDSDRLRGRRSGALNARHGDGDGIGGGSGGRGRN